MRNTERGTGERTSWLRNVQVFTNPLRDEFNYLAMTRNGGGFLCTAINVDRVVAAFAISVSAAMRISAPVSIAIAYLIVGLIWGFVRQR